MGFSHFSGLNVGGGADITTVLKGSVAIDPPSIASGAEATVAVTITGVKVGDSVLMNAPQGGLTAGLGVMTVRVSAANTVHVRLRNFSGGTIDEPSGTWTYLVVSNG